MRHITVRDHATGVSTLWSDWGAWRASRTAPRPAPAWEVPRPSGAAVVSAPHGL